MKIVAWIVLGAIILVVLGLAYYLLVGSIFFKLIFARKNIASKVLLKETEERIKSFKIDLSWWQEVKFETVKIQSFDGLVLTGVENVSSSKKTAIVFHGFGGSHEEMQQYSKFFHDRNFSVLAVDLRSHGKSEGNCVGYGFLESRDVASWAAYVHQKRPNDKIVLFGLSMGATAVCMSVGQKLENVEAVISDCAFASADLQMQNILKDHKILLKIVQKHAYSFVKRMYGVDMFQANAVEEVKNTKIPILFIHGKEDTFVAFENQQILFDATPQALREKFAVDGAKHANSYPTVGRKYERAVENFLEKKTSL